MKTEEALVQVLARNVFYRRLFYLAQGLIALTIVVIALLIAILVYLLHHKPGPLFFATETSGQLINIRSVSEPLPLDEVASWTSQAVQAVYAIDYVNFRQQLQDAQKYFTNYGWYNYMRALEASNNLVTLAKRKQIILVQAAQPTLLKGGLLAGAYAWQFQIPTHITYWNAPFTDATKYTNAVMVNVIVQRQPILQSDHGLGIVQLIASVPVINTAPQQLTINPSA